MKAEYRLLAGLALASRLLIATSAFWQSTYSFTKASLKDLGAAAGRRGIYKEMGGQAIGFGLIIPIELDVPTEA